MELRTLSVEHLGQVKSAILEPSGELSVFFYPDDEVRPGMPTVPWDRRELNAPADEDYYACARCGNTEKALSGKKFSCRRCDHTSCMKALTSRRIT